MSEDNRCYNPRKSLRLMIASVGVTAVLTVAPATVLADTVAEPANGASDVVATAAVVESATITDRAVASDQVAGTTANADIAEAPSDAQKNLATVDQPSNNAVSEPGVIPQPIAPTDSVEPSSPAEPTEPETPVKPDAKPAPGDSAVTEDTKGSGDASDSASSKADGKPSAENVPNAKTDSAEDTDSSAPKVDAPVIDDGVYVIGSGLDQNKVLDVAGGSRTDGANVQLYDSNMSGAQKWLLTYDKNTGYYTAGLAGTNKVLDVRYGSKADGANVWLYEKSKGVNDAQLWKIVKSGNGYSLISKLRADLALDIFGAQSFNGANAQVYTKNDSSAQRFYFYSVNPDVQPGNVLVDGDGAYVVIAGSATSGVALSAGGNHVSAGENIELANKSGVASQRLYFKSDGHGYYTIMVGSSGKMLDAINGGVTPGTNVRQWDANGADAQKWALRRSAEGFYNIVNKASGLALDVFAGYLGSGSNVWTYTSNGSVAQRFWLKKIDNAADGEAAIFENGTYLIESDKDLVKVIDVNAGSRANGANVQLYQSNMSGAQRWNITRKGDTEYYTIRLAGTNKALDVTCGEARDGANVQIFEANGTDSQLWKFVKRNGTLLLVSKLRSDLVLDLFAGGTENGTNAQVYVANGTSAQSFRLISTNANVAAGQKGLDGAYILVAGDSKNGSYAVDINGASRANGTNAQVYSQNKSYAQRFYLKDDGQGFYNVVSVNSGASLDVAGSNLVPYTNVQQWSSYNGDAQKWAIYSNDDGSYSFVSKANGLALDVSGGSFENFSNLQTFWRNGSSAQKFWLVPVAMLDDGIYEINPFINTNKALDIRNGSNSNGGVAQVYDANGTLAQRYQVVRNPDGTYRIRTAASGGWLTESNGSVTQQGSSKTAADGGNSWKLIWNNFFYSLQNVLTGKVFSAANANNGTAISTKSLNGTDNQHFFFNIAQLISNNLYELHSGSQKGKNLDVAGGSNDWGGNIQVWQDNGLNPQKFYITSKGNGYVLKNIVSNLVLDVINGSKDEGANVRQWGANGSDAQLWFAEISDGGGVIFINANSGKALTALSSGNVVQKGDPDQSNAAQRWSLEKTIYYGWLNQGGQWRFFYKNGSFQDFNDAAKRGWDKMVAGHVGSKTNYAIIVDQSSHRTVVFQKADNSWEPIKDWLCGVGRYDLGSTAVGTYETYDKGFMMGTYEYGAEFWWTAFCDTGDGVGQRFHSIIYQGGNPGEGGYIIEDGRGTDCSHGCVRLLVEESKWIYDYCPLGTLVWLYR